MGQTYQLDPLLPDNAAGGGERPARRLYAEAAEGIRRLMRARGLGKGERLPSEMELATALDVSRATVREALVALEVSGAIAVRRNAGAVVVDPTRSLPNRVTGREGGPYEQLEVRVLVEPQAAMLAAHNRTPEACAAMERALERMRGKPEISDELEYGDRDFHLEIARASSNSVLFSTIEALWRMRTQGKLWLQLQSQADMADRRWRAIRDHERILSAIRAGDPAAAQAAMLVHLADVRLVLEEAFGQPEGPGASSHSPALTPR